MAAKSPCIDVCIFDCPTGFCVGCLRTLDESRQWKKMTDFKRHQILNDAKRRKSKVRPIPQSIETKEA
ncbi:DUF1289 domain-containing protein [Rugamonas sp.]|uniref:DUF1289 domain-containing protein n=1 Tax=Rugamonas sp. TaxID=1926287 RepID=UPI0025F837D6|nr:DUF1289 domain-containing protein [Rugamonas sp.]